jgi:hypothetical protein
MINEKIKHVVVYDQEAESAELFEALDLLLDHDNTLLFYETMIGDYFVVVEDTFPRPSDECVMEYVQKHEID